jgi:hypothetical protein
MSVNCVAGVEERRGGGRVCMHGNVEALVGRWCHLEIAHGSLSYILHAHTTPGSHSCKDMYTNA